MSDRNSLARALASAFLASEWREEDLLTIGAQVLGARPPWLAHTVRELLRQFAAPPSSDPALLRAAIQRSRALLEHGSVLGAPPRIARWICAEPVMGAARWPVPALATPVELADFLGISATDLDWFADLKRLNASAESPALEHYSQRWLPKRHGGYRLLEAPKARLRALQRRVLDEVLAEVPVHEAAHGFVRGRSALTCARVHSGQRLLLHLDLREFFSSIRAGRVLRVFRALGYPDAVARTFTGITTTCAPTRVLAAQPALGFSEFRDARAVEERARQRRKLGARHLPQGAPTSPALANLCAFQLDLRLLHAARAVGARYTRYADDLAFSGGEDFARRVTRFEALVGAIAIEQGFAINHRKTRVMHCGARQRLLGLVINEEPGVSRRERDTLEAILTNVLRHGLESQNRDRVPNFLDHLRGRVAWVAQAKPNHARKLNDSLARCELAVDAPRGRGA